MWCNDAKILQCDEHFLETKNWKKRWIFLQTHPIQLIAELLGVTRNVGSEKQRQTSFVSASRLFPPWNRLFIVCVLLCSFFFKQHFPTGMQVYTVESYMYAGFRATLLREKKFIFEQNWSPDQLSSMWDRRSSHLVFHIAPSRTTRTHPSLLLGWTFLVAAEPIPPWHFFSMKDVHICFVYVPVPLSAAGPLLENKTMSFRLGAWRNIVTARRKSNMTHWHTPVLFCEKKHWNWCLSTPLNEYINMDLMGIAEVCCFASTLAFMVAGL